MSAAQRTPSSSPRAENERIRSGHPWIYRTDVADAQAEPGEIVRVLGTRHRAPLG